VVRIYLVEGARRESWSAGRCCLVVVRFLTKNGNSGGATLGSRGIVSCEDWSVRGPVDGRSLVCE
jgi:hypothetical protein